MAFKDKYSDKEEGGKKKITIEAFAIGELLEQVEIQIRKLRMMIK